MKEKVDHIVLLVRKYLRNELSSEENIVLQQWLLEKEENREFFNQFTDEDKKMEELKLYHSIDTARMWEKTMHQPSKIIKILKYTVAVIVAGLAVTATTMYLIKQHKKTVMPSGVAVTKNVQQATPFGTEAILTLADGSSIRLQKVNNGFVKQQGNVKVSQLNNDLQYESINTTQIQNTVYNTIATPNGGRYRVTLPDGSRIWLSAASTIRFCISSANMMRSVTMTGEAYFEVAKKPEIPFRLTILSAKDKTPKAEVEVTGTRFNVNAYDDEEYNSVTLKEGTVKLAVLPVSPNTLISTSENDLKILSSGQEARYNESNPITIIKNIDTATVGAWIKGYLYFNKTPLDITLRRLEKWYGVNVIKAGKDMPDCPFSGTITPETTCRDVLNALEFQYKKLHLNYNEKRKTIAVSYK
jgi:ferric-dicitrate binding protein FerR (iron transport regulator)